MNSRSWGPGRTPGDGSPTERRTTGADAPLRTGTARPLIAWVSLLLTVLCLVLALVGMRANGLLLLATIFAVVFSWAVGAFTRGFWTR